MKIGKICIAISLTLCNISGTNSEHLFGGEQHGRMEWFQIWLWAPKNVTNMRA